MTDSEIIKALECCHYSEYNCDDCPYVDFVGCIRQKERDTLELVKRLQEDVAAQSETITNLIEQIKCFASENLKDYKVEGAKEKTIKKFFYKGDSEDEN